VETLCLAELLAGLSLVADIGMGLEHGEAARAALVAVELAIAVGAPATSDVYYTTLLQHIGCTAYAHEAAALLGGDEIAVKRAAMRTDFGNPGEVIRGYLPSLAPTASWLTQVRADANPLAATHVCKPFSKGMPEPRSVVSETADSTSVRRILAGTA
jgi:hypothetical protein